MNRHRILIVAAIVLCSALWTYACGDGATEPPSPPPDPPRPTTVTVTPATIQLTALGATEQLTAEVRDQNGNTMAGAAVSWASSTATVATVSATGLVTAAGNGTATITATAGSASGSAAVTVAQEVSAVLVSPAADTIVAGDTLRLAAEAADANGHSVSGAEFAWASSDMDVGIVSASGLVTGVGDGDVEITATTSGVTGRAVVTVAVPVPSAVAVEPDTVMFSALGDTVRLAAEVRDQTGRLMNGVAVSWASADASIAAVDSAGLVTAVGGGATTITATTGGVSDEAVVTVMQAGSERAALVALHRATGGPNWTNRDSWLTDAPLAEWQGIEVDADGRVIYVDLESNGLNGPLPSEIGDLSHLQRLILTDNDLEGEIPSELGNLSSLTHLYLGNNAFGGPLPARLSRLSNLRYLSVRDNRLTGPIPPEISRLSELRRLYASVNGLTGSMPRELGSLSNLEVLHLGWNPLSGPIPPELGNLSKLRYLNVGRARYWAATQCDKRRDPSLPVCYPALTGTIPSELGSLPNLEFLDLGWHDLTGPIPPELGNLSSLRTLRLESNRLSGSIPPELGSLSSLTQLLLAENELTGSIPSAIGDLSVLEQLVLSRNKLTDTLPPVLGRLADLRMLDAEYNGLTGRIPRQLGRLASLEELILGFNDLAGSVPAEFGRLASLRELILTANEAMSGPLPDGLTALEELEFLAAGGTRLCAPSNVEFEGWLATMRSAHVAPCTSERAAAYLVQAVQSRELPVPLVAGDDALVRVFPTAAVSTNAGIPAVRVRFYVDGRETHLEEIPAKAGPLPTEVDEGSLETSANAVIAGRVVQPGLEMVVEIDPDGTLDESLGVARRIPERGRLAVDVRAMPEFHLTIVPLLWTERPDSTVLDITKAMSEDPLNHELLWKMSTLLPIADDFDVDLHEPVWISKNEFFTAVTEAIRIMEGAPGYYLGAMTGEVGSKKDANYGRTISTWPADRNIGHITHEFGHTMTLGHTPGCWPGTKDSFTDPSYPYSTGIAGVWGYDFRDGGRLVQPTRVEVMAFCGGYRDGWISDYHFTKMLRHRLRDDVEDAAATAAPGPSILLWGGVDKSGVPFLEPMFVVDARPTLPDSAGEHRVIGRTSSGDELFSLSFRMPEDPHGEDSRAGFVFAVPARAEWADALASITLSGPGGSVTLDGETDRPMAILRNPRTRQIRGIVNDPPLATQAAADAGAALAPGLEVLLSRGIPDTAAWRR